MTVKTYVLDAQGIPTIDKRVGSALDYTFDFSKWLALVSDSLASYNVALSNAEGVTITDDSESTGKVSVWLSKGGTEYSVAEVTCHIVTTGGREETAVIHIRLIP